MLDVESKDPGRVFIPCQKQQKYITSVQEVDFEDEESVKQATDLLLQKELGEEVIEGEVEQEIIQDEHDFKVIEPQDIVSEEDASMVGYRL